MRGLDYWSRMLVRNGMDGLPAHLERTYGIRVARTAELDLGVLRVDRHDGPSWVARVFPAARPLAEVEGDESLLLALERHGFPAERCAAPEAVSTHEGQGILVTEFVAGSRADGRGHTFGVLGALLGRLHARPVPSTMRSGGAWHHVAVQGGPGDEVAAALAMLDEVGPRVPADERGLHEALREEVAQIDDCEDLPHAFVHPDFVPVNAITRTDGRTVIVDWTGAGRGPRLWCLAFLLWAGGARDLMLVDVAVSQYRKHVGLEPEELSRLPSAMRGRPLILDCWMYCVGRRSLSEVSEELGARRPVAEGIAARAIQGFTADAG